MTHEFDDERPTKIQSLDQIDRDLLKRGTVKLDKTSRVPEPTEWGWGLKEEPVWGFEKGANRMYRDSKPFNSIQVREYDNYYLIQLDHANPAEGEIIKHYRMDISPAQKAGLAVGALALAGLAALAIGS